MTKGTFDDFSDALLAFESGWDRERYENGQIQDWQLNEWANGSVEDFYPDYSSWGELNDAEWEAMAHRSMNSLGFVGFQFGEALLIDLGYYDDDQFYGNGASTNTWDGQWTGKNGVYSLEDFMTAEAQQLAIQEAFGYNLQIISEGLENSGESLDDYIGTTRTYIQNGEEVTVTITETGLMAAAHLRGAYGTLALLQSDDVSTDEYGTSILYYIDVFGDYDSPTVDEIIAIFEDNLTGDEGVGTPGDTGDTSDTDETGGDTGGNADDSTGEGTTSTGGAFDNPSVTSQNADVVVTWAWGAEAVISDFNPATDTVFIDWFSADQLQISETEAGLVFAVATNNQTLTLAGVSLADLVAENIHAQDSSLQAALEELTGESDGETDGGHDDGGDGGHDDDGNMTGTMHMITLSSDDGLITDFDPAKDMIHIESGVTGDRFEIFEESGDALGLTTRIVVTDTDGTILSTTIFQGVGLSDLDMSNFSLAEESAQNEVASALGTVIVTPGDGGGYEVTYDSDGSTPPVITGQNDAGGNMYRADTNADDIVGFDASVDQIDFGGTSVHGMIITKTPNGEIAIDSPWSAELQILQGIGYNDITIENLGIVGNEHLRQDIGGVISWEQGVGPREDDTVYIRSHEYGVHDVIDDFDVATMKISFLYFGTRERLSVEDTDAGLVISSLPSGQSVTLTGVELADLQPGQIEFHHDQVMEDNLEVPFGMSQDEVTLVDRTMLLTPEAPEGATTDGYQTREGVFDGSGGSDGGETGGDETDGGDPDAFVFAPGEDRAEITWNWATQTVIEGFDTQEDVIDFNALSAMDIAISEVDGSLVIEVLNNGGRTVTLSGLQAEDLNAANLTADDWNGILDPSSDLMLQLQSYGMDLG